MKPVTLEEVTEKIEYIPTLSEIYHAVSGMLENPKVSASDVADVISRDPALTSKLLKIVNSAFYGLPQQVSTLTHALVLLGFTTVRSLILAMELADMFESDRFSHFPRRAFWIHCFATGLIGKNIAVRLGRRNLEEIFIQGLLHDIGKIVLDKYESPSFGVIMELVGKENILVYEAEKRVLGFTHAEIASAVMRRWNLPTLICDAAAQHHTPEAAGDLALDASIVHLADIVSRAKQLGSGGDRRIPALSPWAWSRLGLDWKALEKIMEEAESFSECGIIFE